MPRIALVSVLLFLAFKANSQELIGDSATFIIRNISYYGKIISANDTSFFKVSAYNVPAITHRKNPELCSNNMFLRCKVIFYYKKGDAPGGERRMDFFIAPANTTAEMEQLIVYGNFYSRHVYVLDTLIYCCSGNWLKIPDVNEIMSDTIHLSSEAVTNYYVVQTKSVSDSVFLVRKKEIAESKSLTGLNKDKKIIYYLKRTACSDSVVSNIDLRLTKNKTLATDFYANGNINRVYTRENYTEWKFFYRHTYFTDGDHLKRKFDLIKKLHLVRYVDTCTNYFPDGKKYKEITSLTDNPNVGYRIVNAWDTNGVQTLVNGNGFYYEYELWGSYENYSIKHYKNYVLDGEYKSYKKGVLYYSAEYKNGILYNEHRIGDKYSRTMEYNPVTDSYTISDFDADGKLASQKTFSRATILVSIPVDYGYIYYYPTVFDQPH
jgi:hypothetical protein